MYTKYNNLSNAGSKKGKLRLRYTRGALSGYSKLSIYNCPLKLDDGMISISFVQEKRERTPIVKVTIWLIFMTLKFEIISYTGNYWQQGYLFSLWLVCDWIYQKIYKIGILTTVDIIHAKHPFRIIIFTKDLTRFLISG